MSKELWRSSAATASAIERLRAWSGETGNFAQRALDVDTLLAEVERLQSVEWRTNEHRDQASANFDSMMKAKDEVDRLRAEREALVTAISARADEVAPDVNFEETNAAASEERTLTWVLSLLATDSEMAQ